MENISELAKMAANGDNAAFEGLYEQTKGGVWFTCINLLKNEENAKDVMQETYITAFERLGSLADYSGIQSWLNKIAANKCKNYIRTVSNSHLAENGEELLENIPDDKLIPEEYVTDIAKRRIIMEIIEKALSEDQYRTIILYYFDEMTAIEIAELMEVHEKTVLYRLKVARQKIKEAIMRYEEENKDKLHGVVFIPTLTRLFRAEAENTPVPNVPLDVKISPNTQTVPSEQTTLSEKVVAKQGGKAMLNTLKAKIIAGACAAVVVGGGVTAGVIIANNAKDNENFPAYSAGTNMSKPTNTSKPSANSNSGSGTTSKPAASTPAQTDQVVYPKFEGLEARKFINRINGENQPDVVSGKIKEMRLGDRAFILLTNDNEVVMYRADAYEVKVSYGIDPNITTLDNLSYDYLNGDGILAINGNYITYKALDNDGEVRLSKEGNPRTFSGYMDFGDRITEVRIADRYRFYALDAEGLSIKLSHKYWDHTEREMSRFDESIMDGDYVYYSTSNDWGFYVGNVKIKEFAGDYCLTDEGKMHNHDDRKPLDFLAEYTFKDIYYDSINDNGIITGITEDDKLITFDAVRQTVLFTGELPEGAIQNIWQNSSRVIVKTDKGVYRAEYETDDALKPFDVLNNTGEEVVWVVGKYVLLGDGFVYEIK